MVGMSTACVLFLTFLPEPALPEPALHCCPVRTDGRVIQVGWGARKTAAQSPLEWTALQPKKDLHRKPGVLDRVVQIASTSELDMAADRAQRGAAAELERP